MGNLDSKNSSEGVQLTVRRVLEATFASLVLTLKLTTLKTISVPKRQNPVPLNLMKLTYRALEFLVHFSSVLPTKLLQRQSALVTHKKVILRGPFPDFK